MKIFKYLFIFTLPLIFLSIIGNIFLIPSNKKNTKLGSNKFEAKIKSNLSTLSDSDEDNVKYLYTIIIDPGQTKLALNFSYELARSFRNKGVNVYLTRNSDYQIGQVEKFEILYKHDSALYIHINPIYNYDNNFLLITLDNSSVNNDDINFIPNAISKSEKSLKIEENLIHAFKFYFSLSESQVQSKYLESIDVPIDIPAISLNFKYNYSKISSYVNLISKAVLMGLSK